MTTSNRAKTRVSLKQLSGKQILGQAGFHSLLTDRKKSDGGDDLGFTSSELLLLSIGSCALANIRRCSQENNISIEPIQLDVQYTNNPAGGRDLIEVLLFLEHDLPDIQFAQISQAARSGGVTGRLNQISELKISKIINSL